MSHLARTFFVMITPKYLESVFENLFQLKHQGNWDLRETFNYPVGFRNWLIERLRKQLEEEAKKNKT